MYSAPPASAAATGIPGVDVSNERQPVELADFQGSVMPDRAFPIQKTWEFNVARERDPRTGPETLNRNFNIPSRGCESTTPTPRWRIWSRGVCPPRAWGTGGGTTRGDGTPPTAADFHPAGARMSDMYHATVLPERAATTSNPTQVSDAYNGVEASRWGSSDHNRGDPKRYATLDALESHPAPGDKHTRVQVNKVFEWRDANSELPESMEVMENTQQVARFPKIGDAELGAVGRSVEDVSNYTAQEKNRGDRMERPGRVGVSSVQMGVGDSSNVAAYSALMKNPYYIPNISHPDS
eukprot:jgi/Mesvir1/14120/Mv20255-RA.1